MNIQELINQLHILNQDSILYCFPDTDDDSQTLADEFPAIHIIQELGCWVPNGTRTSISVALQRKYNAVCVPVSVSGDMLTGGIACLNPGGHLFTDMAIKIKDTGLARGTELGGVYRYKKK